MYNDEFNNTGNQVHWNGSSYSTPNYHVEDAPDPAQPVSPPSGGKKKGRGAAKAVALVLCCALIGGGAGVGGAAVYGVLTKPENTTTIYESTVEGTTVNVQQTQAGEPMSLSEIYNTYADACVCITAQVPYTTSSWFGNSTSMATSAGSGFIISDNGYIVTNYHVIDGATSVTVTLFNGDEYEATYVGGEESNDVAILKIDAAGLTHVVLGDSDQLTVGEQVCTIGNALGTLSFSQTSGYVSGLGRSVTYSDGTIINMLQTDCTINSGNSGGPLFNSYGQVVGITSAKYSNNADASSASIENIGFAIPINDVKNIISDIMEHGYVIRPSMGIEVATVTEQFSEYFNWPLGAYVNSVEEGSCAEAAGLKQGDIITAIGGTEITTANELIAAKNTYSPGDTAELTIFRAGETLTLSITFEASEDPTASNDNAGSSSGPQGDTDLAPAPTSNWDYGYDYGYSDPYGDFFGDFFGRGY